MAIGLLALGIGCGEGTAPPEPVATVSVNAPAPRDVVPGGTKMLTVVTSDAKGTALVDRTVTWTSSDPTKATVVAGLVTGVGLGPVTITASSEGKTGSVDLVVKEGSVCGASGCTFTAAASVVTETVPAGALSQTLNLTVEKSTTAPASPRLLPNTAFDFGPSGTQFTTPVTVTIKYDPATVASDSPESGLQLYEVQGATWRVVPGSTVNLTTKTVTGAVSRFSTYAVLMQAKVETVTITGDFSPVPVTTTRQLGATLKDNEGLTLSNRAIAWTSSNPAILSIDPATGLAKGNTLGTVTITATSETRSATQSLTVVPGPPAKIVIVAGNGQSVAAGSAVPVAASVRVTDAIDNPIANVAVNFAVTAGAGSITGAVATTNADGIATAGTWTLGTKAGANTVTVTSPVIAGASAVFTAAAVAGPATTVAATAGNGQTGTAGGFIATKPSVLVTDANGNPVAGFPVTFTPGSGSGSVTFGSTFTDASGIATVGSWKLGTAAGAQALSAAAASLAGSPVVFTATAVAPVAANLSLSAGNDQSAKPNFAVPVRPAVVITDPAGVPVPGVTVTFAVASGGGTITGASVVTGDDGIATVGSWVLGPSAGANSLTATSGTLTGSPYTFNATAIPAPPTNINLAAGNGQNASAGKPTPIPPTVKVVDADGVAVPNVSVTWVIRSGTGSISNSTALTNSIGTASVSWTLGLGPNSLSAQVAGLIGSPVTFSAVGQADVQIVTFGDSNTDLGFAGTDPAAKVGSYVSGINPAIRLGPDAPNSPLQLANKIEIRWKANRQTQTIKAVNHAIAGTFTNSGTSILTSPNALHVVNGVSRFAGEVLGVAYPWSGGEGPNESYPTGPVLRVQAFKPRAVDYAYLSMGTNDIGEGTPAATIKANLETMVDMWIQAGLPPNHLIITTLPPRRTGTTDNPRILALNSMIRTLSAKGVRVVDLAFFTFSDDGTTWKLPSYHVTNDEYHYSETVRDWLADQIVSIMLQGTPP
ncbi:MAG TPA: GDSL-type esterase/lipase family protein [Gemmatimonadaceae bacterium]|nr:GDSL-type esterase/lipase family protein [Gemmatimonadaceae bacterium]